MAYFRGSTKDKLKIIIKQDDAIGHKADYEMYSKTLDESHLDLIAEPTRFVLVKDLPYEAQQNIADRQMGLSADGKAEVRMSFIMEEIRCALVDIENPPMIPEDQKLLFKKASDGFAAKELIAMLQSDGIVMQLYSTASFIIIE